MANLAIQLAQKVMVKALKWRTNKETKMNQM